MTSRSMSMTVANDSLNSGVVLTSRMFDASMAVSIMTDMMKMVRPWLCALRERE